MGENKIKPITFGELGIILLILAMAVTLIALQLKPLGWALYFSGLLALLLIRRDIAKNFLLIFIGLGIVGLTPITTEVNTLHLFQMGGALALAVGLPYLISRYVYKSKLVRFPWHHGRHWSKREYLFILITLIIAYFLLPFYLRETGAILNWQSAADPANVGRLFLGTNGLGIWDELFFVNVVLGILRNYMSFKWANFIQATLFTSFLYELGFTGWGFVMIFVFAIFQGIIFKKTASLAYVITIHLALDFVLFLALVNGYHPNLFNIFIT